MEFDISVGLYREGNYSKFWLRGEMLDREKT